MDLLLGQIINAILLGCTYTLVAIGFSLFFGVLDVVIFCCGDIAIFGAFSILGSYTILASTGFFGALPYSVSVLMLLLIAAILCASLGLLTYRFSVKPFENSSALMPLLSTIALGVVIRESLGLLFQRVVNPMAKAVAAGGDALAVQGGRNPQAMPVLIAPDGTVTERNLIIIGVTLILLLALFWFLNKTKIGLSMQAVSQNRDVSCMIGVNVKRIVILTFIIGGALLSIGGFLVGSYNTLVRFDNGSNYGIKGFSAAVVGGLSNTYGAIVGGMLLAFVEVFVSGYIPNGTAYASIIAFVVVVLFIMFKPEGILGEKTVEKV
ncbi:MAG: branched-chain amino acid ABC transporter permease [Bacillota bacterium]|jgi:branched-chain amino acid transport system permease protein